ERGFKSLTYRRGPGFVAIPDRRPNLPTADYVLRGLQAAIYAACEDGATLEKLCATLHGSSGRAIDAARLLDFLESLVELRLMCAEDGHYLSLALPARPSAAIRRDPSAAATPTEGTPPRRALPMLAKSA